MNRSLLAYLALLLIAASSAFAEPNVCPPREVGPSEPEELLMHESDFSLEKARKSVDFLRSDFSKRIWGNEPVEDFSAWSGHYISYMNSLRFIEGALLREQALRLRAKSEALAARKPNSPSAKSARAAFLEAKSEFCKFIDNSIYVD